MSKRRVLVGVKRCVDYAVKIRVRPDNLGVVTQNIKMSMNPFDEIAVTEAVTMKKDFPFDEIVAVSMGPKESQEVIRRALAMGADRGILVQTDDDLQPLAVAKLFKAVVEKEHPDIVILGKQAIDDDCNQTGQMLAGLLGWPQGTHANTLRFSVDKTTLECTRETDTGLQTVRLKLPCVVTCDLRLNEPVFAKLPEIMKAKSKPLTTFTPQQLNVDIKTNLKTVRVTEPPKRQAGKILETVDELIAALRKEGVVQ
jgi:electron transfer flavoprotein beta subunit